MNYFGLIFCQLVILSVLYRLGQSQNFLYNLKLYSVVREDSGKEWLDVEIFKYVNEHKFTFNNNDIYDGAFSSANVEIIEVFNRAVRFSVLGSTNVAFSVLFTESTSVEQFFRDIRSQHNRTRTLTISNLKLFQYQIMEYKKGTNRLQLLALSAEIYTKILGATLFERTKSINFVRHDVDARSEIVDLVMLSKTFNISEQFGTNKVVLCSASILTHVFILSFHNYDDVNDFDEFIKNDLDDKIPCDWKKWISYGVYREINTFK